MEIYLGQSNIIRFYELQNLDWIEFPRRGISSHLVLFALSFPFGLQPTRIHSIFVVIVVRTSTP